MPDREKVIKGLEELYGFLFREYANIPAEESKIYYERTCAIRDALALLKEQEEMNIDAFVQWCIDSHIMGDATVRGIKYWAGKFKEGR